MSTTPSTTHPPHHSSTVRLAQAFASGAHRNQTDHAGQPYIGHPARVARRLESDGASPEVVAAAWLHDVVEDTAFGLNDIHALFGDEVAKLVDLLTRREGQSYEEYLDRLATSPEALLIKLCDILDNADPDRLRLLDLATSTRLARKYLAAIQQLKEHVHAIA